MGAILCSLVIVSLVGVLYPASAFLFKIVPHGKGKLSSTVKMSVKKVPVMDVRS